MKQLWSKITLDPDRYLIPGDKTIHDLGLDGYAVVAGDESYVESG